MNSNISFPQLIEKAIDKHLTEPDWKLNMEICDYLNSNIES